MITYILKRLGQTMLIVIAVSILSFLLVSLMPRDPVYALHGTTISQAEYDVAFKEMNLDKPLFEQYFIWAKKAICGDFGVSYRYHMPVIELAGKRFGISVYLSIASTLISFPIGILFGIITAVKKGKWQDNVITLIANFFSSIPGFVVAIFLMFIFCMHWNLLPTNGFVFPWDDFSLHVKQAILPLICLSLGNIASICRQTRSSMLENIRQDYVRTARSKGLKENVIINKHVLKNGLIPIITLLGNRMAGMLGSTLLVETIFSIPGMGSFMVQAVNNVDMPVMQCCVLIFTLVISLSYLLTDILYLIVDPRIVLK